MKHLNVNLSLTRLLLNRLDLFTRKVNIQLLVDKVVIVDSCWLKHYVVFMCCLVTFQLFNLSISKYCLNVISLLFIKYSIEKAESANSI